MTLEDLVEEVRGHPEFTESGAIVTFTGVVRSSTGDREVDHLEFESYEEVSESELRRLEEELRNRDGVVDVRMHHRTGRIDVGEDIVHIVVASGHRDRGFEVCREAIDRLKREVSLWKKEVTKDGERWMHDHA
ncbi:MAG: putative molybdopterin synthase [Methanonatronarchaeales archaeon]|nr:putative molybdopterin synthase [Methanonatronarchaeales archaeon]